MYFIRLHPIDINLSGGKQGSGNQQGRHWRFNGKKKKLDVHEHDWLKLKLSQISNKQSVLQSQAALWLNIYIAQQVNIK